MAINEQIRELLELHGVSYLVHPHREVFTPQEVAQITHVPGRCLAKSVVVCNAEGGHLLYVLPAPEHVRLDLFRRLARLEHLQFATEAEIAPLFPDCELGAEPPIGRLYNMPTLMDESLVADARVMFCAGTHRDAITMTLTEYRRVAQPEMGYFGRHI